MHVAETLLQEQKEINDADFMKAQLNATQQSKLQKLEDVCKTLRLLRDVENFELDFNLDVYNRRFFVIYIRYCMSDATLDSIETPAINIHYEAQLDRTSTM